MSRVERSAIFFCWLGVKDGETTDTIYNTGQTPLLYRYKFSKGKLQVEFPKFNSPSIGMLMSCRFDFLIIKYNYFHKRIETYNVQGFHFRFL